MQVVASCRIVENQASELGILVISAMGERDGVMTAG